ncbi:MAG: hypothetical protein HUU38_12560 [Anaerolineales bacterium]|nr:hypothetical protein [Anaerolineales bacterium]
MSSYQNSPFSMQTGAQQTMSSWARVIEAFAEIPEAFKPTFKTLVGAEPLFPYTVFAPIISGRLHKTTEKLVFEMGETLYILERTREEVKSFAYPYSMISDFEFGSILLYSWVTFRGVTQAGIAASTTIELNTTSVRHFTRFVNRLRPAPQKMEQIKQQAERAKFDYLENENFKFMNYGMVSLVEGEKVIQTVWQPQINFPIMKLGWHTFYRTRALAHLLVLTDQELIMIQDDERSEENRGVRYGGKWRYIGLDHLETVEVQEDRDKLIRLTLSVTPGKQQMESFFAASHREEILQLQETLQKINIPSHN